MNFKKILGSFLSAMTIFTTTPVSVMAFDITSEATLSEYMLGTELNKEQGNILNDVITTSEIEAKNADIKFYVSGDKVLTGELLRFTSGTVTLSQSGNSSLTIKNDIHLSGGVTLSNDRSGTYNFGRILGSGTVTLSDKSIFTASEINAGNFSLTKSSLTMYTDESKDADGSITINDKMTISGSNTVLTANNIEAKSLEAKDYSTLNAKGVTVEEFKLDNSSIANVSKLNADNKNIGTVTTKDLTMTSGAKLYADIVDASGNVSLSDKAEIDLVGDESSSSGLSQNGVLYVDGKLYITGNSSVKANEIEANEIESTGKIIIGKEGIASAIKADKMTVTTGDYLNTVISGKTTGYSDIKFSSGGSVSFSGTLNQLNMAGGSQSANASLNINDDSALTIVSGPTDTVKPVVFDGTKFNLGENAKLDLNAIGNDIQFQQKANIEMTDTSEVSVGAGKKSVMLSNINSSSDENKGILSISGNAQIIQAGSQDDNHEFQYGQVYVDKYVQNAGSSMTMNESSTLNANTINITDSTLTLNNISNGTSKDGKSQKDGIKANDSFNMTNSTLVVDGKSQIEAINNLDFTGSSIRIQKSGVLSLGAGTDLLIDSTSSIITSGEIRFFGDNGVYDLQSSLSDGEDAGTLRKVGSSTLNIGIEPKEDVDKTINTIVIGGDDSQSSDFVGGVVNVNETIDVKQVKVVGNSVVNIAEKVTLGDLGNGNSSEIRFMNDNAFNSKASSAVSSVLNLGKDASLIASKIELSVKEANLYGGTIGDEDITKTLIFGEGSTINVYDTSVAVNVKNATSGGFVSSGSTINLTGRGSLIFDTPITSAAHWNISANAVQQFKADSRFDGITKQYKMAKGGIFNNQGGSVIIGDRTVFGASSDGNLVNEEGGAVRNTGYFGSEITGATSSGVSFIKNGANSSSQEPGSVVKEYCGAGGAIYNTYDADASLNGEVSLGSMTTFQDNYAGRWGGAIYNDAVNSQRGAITEVKNAISLGDEALFSENFARELGGAIYTENVENPTKESTISIGKKSSFITNDVGFDRDVVGDDPSLTNTTKPDSNHFYEAKGGAIYAGKNTTVDIGEHSGFYDNFSSFIGSAIYNEGTIVFNDDGKINDEALRENGDVVQGAVKFYDNGSRQDEKDATNVFYTHQGGAIFNNGGNFVTKLSDGSEKNGLYNASFENNQALFGGAIYNYATNAEDLLSVENSTFSGNKAVKGIELYKDPNEPSSQNKWQLNSSGGAIYNAGSYKDYDVKKDDKLRGPYPVERMNYNNGSKMSITSSSFDNNSAVDKAGAVYNDVMSSLELSDVTFNSNAATKGGAVYNAGSDGTHAGATIITKLGSDGQKIIFSGNTATRQMDGNEQVSPDDEYLGGALYNAGTIKQSGSTSSYDNEIIGFEFVNNYAGAGVGTDIAKDVIGRGGAFYNASAGTTYIADTKFEGNATTAYTKDGVDSDNYKSEGGAIYNEQGTLIIGEGAEFIGNGNQETGRGGAIYNNSGATVEIKSDKAVFSGNLVANDGGAIYNAKDGTLKLDSNVTIGAKDVNSNYANRGGGIFNAGNMTLADNVSFVNNSAVQGGALYLKEGSTVNVDGEGINHLSNVTFEGNHADYGAGLYVDKNLNILLDNVTFVGNSVSEIGSAFYNAGNLTLGANNKFENNFGSLIGNSGTLTFKEGFEFDALKKGNQNNSSFLTNEKDGVVNLTTVNGSSLSVLGVGNGEYDGAAITLKDNSSINTDSEANTIMNATFKENDGRNGGAVYKASTVDLTIKDTVFDGNSATNGGAIYNEKGTLNIGNGTVFSNNSAVDGGAINNAENATLNFVAGYKGFSSIGGNYAETGYGGAVANFGKMNIQYADDNSLSIDFSNQGKEATGNGGALYLAQQSLVTSNNEAKQDSNGNIYSYIKNAVFSNNKAENGGALFNESNIVIENTDFYNNVSSGNGGAIYNRGSNTAEGKSYGNLNLILSEDKTLTNNRSDSSAGAIYNENGTVTISAKDGNTALISQNTSYGNGGAIVSAGKDSVLNINGNVIFKDNGAKANGSVGGAILVSEGILNLDTTDGDIVFDGNFASLGSAIYADGEATINFKGGETNKITFTKNQTIASDDTMNKMNVLSGNVNFESNLGDFNGKYYQKGGVVTVANEFMNLQGKNNEIIGGTFVVTEGAKLAQTDDILGNNLVVNGNYADVSTIKFENNSVSSLTDVSAIYKNKDTLINSGATLTYTSDLGDAKISLSNAKLDLALKQKLVDVVDSKTGKTYKVNSGEYDLVLDGGADKNPISVAKDGKHAVSELVLGDAVKVSTNIEIAKDGVISLEGAGLAADKDNYVKKIELTSGQLNIFNDTYETTVGDVTTKYNTDLTFYGDLVGDSNSLVYKGYKTSPAEDGSAGRATLTFDVLKDENGNVISAASAADYLGQYIQNAGTLEFKEGSTYFNHENDKVSFVEDAKLILNEGVKYTGDTTINFDGDGGRFVLGNATAIDMTKDNPPEYKEKIEFDAKDVNGNDVHNKVVLGKDTTIQVTHGKTDVDASNDEIKIGSNNAFSGIIIGGEESKNDDINIKVNTKDVEGTDTKFTVEENGKLGFGDVNFVDTYGTAATDYSPTVTLGKNAELYLVSERDNDFKNLNLSTDATAWSATAGNLVKENASKTTLTGEKTDLSGFHGTIVVKNGEIALGDDITNDKKFADDTHFDLSKMENNAVINVTNITSGNDISLINGIGNEILGLATGDENYTLSIKNDKGGIKFVTEEGSTYKPDIDVENGSFLKMDAKGDIDIENINVISKFSSISGNKQESQAGLISQGNVSVGKINVIGAVKNTTIADSTMLIKANGNITSTGNVNVEYGNLGMESQTGSITLGDVTDTVNPALIVANGYAEISAKDALTINGNVSLDALTKDSLLQGSSVSMGGLTVSNSADKNALINATSGKVNINGYVDVSNTELAQITAANGIGINSTDIDGGSLSVSNSNFNAITTTGNINVDGNLRATDSSVNIVVKENGVGDVTIGNNDVALPAISATNSSINISSEGLTKINGNIELNNLKDTSSIIGKSLDINGDVTDVNSQNGARFMAEDGNLTVGKVTLDNNELNDAFVAKNGSITTKGDVVVNEAGLIMLSLDGGINIASDSTGTDTALKVSHGSAFINAVNGALTINGDVDMTGLTDDAIMHVSSVSMGNLKLHENVKDSLIKATDGDVSIKSITLTNNSETVDGVVTNKTTQISATNGNINVQDNIDVSLSNLTMAADGGITGKDLIVANSKVAPATKDDVETAGTILSAGTGDISLNKVSIDDSVVGIQSTSGNINIDKTLEVADSSKLSQAYINAESGSLSIGSGLTAPADNSAVTAISAKNAYVVAKAGGDITIGNDSVKTNAVVADARVMIESENGSVNASKTDFTVTRTDADVVESTLYVVAKDDISVGEITSVSSEAAFVAQNGKLSVDGDVISVASITSLVGGEGGINVKGSVESVYNTGTSIQSTGNVYIGKNLTLTNNVSSEFQLDLAVDKLKTAELSSTSTNNNDTPNEDINKIIGSIQDLRSTVAYDSAVDGANVVVNGSLTADTTNLAIGGVSPVSKLQVNGSTDIDSSVVMINSSGKVITNGFKSTDSIVTVKADELDASSLNVSASNSNNLSYLEMLQGDINVSNGMTMTNALLNAKNTENISVGGAGNFNNTFLNIPNANAQFGSLKTTNTMVSLSNNKAGNTISVAGDYNVSGKNLYYMDFDPASGSYDKVHAGGTITGTEGATITVNSNIVNKGDVANGYQVYDVFSADKGINGVNFGLQGDTAYSTTLANYQMQSLGGGKYAFKRSGYNPTALVNPVAVQVGGFLTQVQTYDTAFDNLDMVMMLPMTAYGPNRYAVSEAEDAMVYSPLFIPELEKGIWFRPFANFEKVDMSQVGGDITSQTYGALVGGDTALKDLGNGYQGMMSAYVGYTGSHQDLDGISNYQNGAVVGVTGALYKNGFFSGLTVSANASGNTASTPVGDNDFMMLTAGVASKTGYNWELANGRFIIQPSWLMSYTFSDIYNTDKIAGMKVDADALHAVQLAPGLKLIGNFSNGWQPYLTVDYRFNLCDETDYRVGVVDLPEAKVKSYIEYGVGMQKRWGDRFTGYGQFLGRGIGRNGVGLNLGMRWMMGNGRNPR